jgi:hypothetical protein
VIGWRHWPAVLLSLLILPATVAGGFDIIKTAPCSIILQVLNVVDTVVPTLVVLMFTYGGITYLMSVDNPGGRKQGKDICIHAVIGGIIYALWAAIEPLLRASVTWWTSC